MIFFIYWTIKFSRNNLVFKLWRTLFHYKTRRSLSVASEQKSIVNLSHVLSLFIIGYPHPQSLKRLKCLVMTSLAGNDESAKLKNLAVNYTFNTQLSIMLNNVFNNVQQNFECIEMDQILTNKCKMLWPISLQHMSAVLQESVMVGCIPLHSTVSGQCHSVCHTKIMFVRCCFSCVPSIHFHE